MDKSEIIDWLLLGDDSIKYQTKRDLLGIKDIELQKKIKNGGWAGYILSKRESNGHWGRGFYQPKWTSTHYTLLDLKNLNIYPDNSEVKSSIDMLLESEKGDDGGMNPSNSISQSDLCINGMFLNYASYFLCSEEGLKSIVDFILKWPMEDGGFNCRLNRSGAKHSSLHTTICVIEGIYEYFKNGYNYRVDELMKMMKSSIEFILCHRLYLSDRTGEIIHKDFLKLSYPSRWRYDILRTLDFFSYSKTTYDSRMEPALEFIKNKRRKDGLWNLQAKHPGALHVEMEKAGKPSRWNTLRALRVLDYYGAAL